MISEDTDVPNSEHALMETLLKLSDAGGSVIQIRTREPLRAALVLRKHFVAGDVPYNEWDAVNGVRRFTRENYTDHRTQGEEVDFVGALQTPLRQLRDSSSAVHLHSDKTHYFVFVDPHPYVAGNPYVSELIQQYAMILPTTNVCLLFITPDVTLQDVPTGTMLIADMSTPSVPELEEVLRRVIEPAVANKSFRKGSMLDDDDFLSVCRMGLGLTLHEFETYASISIIEAALAKEDAITVDRLMAGIAKGKTAVVRQSEILELTHTEDIGDIGGMNHLKEWIAARSACYSQEAKEYGIAPPKGMVLVGVPGTGKSLVAKATASSLGVPLVRLDFGRVFSKFVGDSESRVRAALRMVESMAPVVLFVDEIDKGLGGAGGGADSGVSSRVLGSYLTWLQECEAPVFSVVTANRIDGLPPELLRKGRFDQIFSVVLPTVEERREVFAIHLRKRGRSIDDYGTNDLIEFDKVSEGYVPAEIESVIKDGLIAAFNDGSDKLKMRYIIEAFKESKPMSLAHKASIDRIIEWAAAHATPVTKPRVREAQQGTIRRTVVRARS